jgi:hypothetical protein
MNSKWLAGMVVLVGAVASIPGCGGASIGDACQHICDCSENCSPKDEASCEETAAAEQTLASKAGCSSEFDDATSCSNGATCQDGTIQLQDCAAEADALTKCIDDAGFGGGDVIGGDGDGGSKSSGGTPNEGGGTVVVGTGDGGGKASGGSDVCAQGAKHEAVCTSTSVGTIPAQDCTGMAECSYSCILAASCGALTGQDAAGAQKYSMCVSACEN